MELLNKVVVITGISKGIGRATTELLLSKGCKVYGLGMSEPIYTHANLNFIPTNVRNFDEVTAAMDEVKKMESEVHVLINNAGVGYFGLLEDTEVEIWHEMFETNVNSIFYTCKHILPMMKQQQYGHVINIASTAALEGMPQVSGYCGTKWAVKGITESLWRECREDKVKVTCVYPGSTKTDFFRNSPGIKPHDYMLQPEDVASMIVYALETPDNFHQVNLEVRPLQPKGPKK
ncbi:MAG: SDR family oxidoreductase [Bacteroidetes bacterium]|nr:SDR family oxidoreductase [Bacteroidota bacterium]